MKQNSSPIKEKLYSIVFKADTRAGKTFDLFLIAVIIFSIIVVMAESVSSVWEQYGNTLKILEWVITVLFSIEYILRIIIVHRPRKFIFSFYGLIDLLACLPAYIGIFTTAGAGLVVIRALRLLRLFRILKLTRYTNASSYIWEALKASRFKISIFLYTIMTLVIVIGALMYFVEDGASGFDSIPRAMYWVIVTITTVGYGDIAPMTTAGQFIASIVMIMGYAIIAVPTGIVTAETVRLKHKDTDSKPCPRCHTLNKSEANYCSKCGEKIAQTEQ